MQGQRADMKRQGVEWDRAHDVKSNNNQQKIKRYELLYGYNHRIHLQDYLYAQLLKIFCSRLAKTWHNLISCVLQSL